MALFPSTIVVREWYPHTRTIHFWGITSLYTLLDTNLVLLEDLTFVCFSFICLQARSLRDYLWCKMPSSPIMDNLETSLRNIFSSELEILIDYLQTLSYDHPRVPAPPGMELLMEDLMWCGDYRSLPVLFSCHQLRSIISFKLIQNKIWRPIQNIHLETEELLQIPHLFYP